MILIFSKRTREISTDNVLRWIRHFNHPVKRINAEDYNEQKNQFTLSNSIENKYKSIWFRRWSIPLFNLDTDKLTPKEAYFSVITFMLAEYWSSCNAFFNSFEKSNWLSHPSTSSMDKLLVLKKAKEFDLLIPETIVSNNKLAVIEFKNIHNNIITKPLTEVLNLEDDDFMYQMYTTEITDLNNLPDFFPYSLFQNKINKKYEIRSFFIEDKFYSMAIFSQNNDKTVLDFRKYDFETPNRNVPFKLPKDIENKLNKLMKSLKLNTGSIDLVYSDKNEFIFLEVNPVGQYGMTSMPCNYNLDKKVAEYLIKKDN